MTPSILKLVAAIGSRIPVYGTRKLDLDIGLRRIFPWMYTIADVSRPILGTDFLSHYDILVDLKSKSYLTNVTFRGKISYESTPKITVLKMSAEFHSLISEYQRHFRGEKTRIKDLPHNVSHVIEAKGQPVIAKARRLSVDKLEAARAEFNYLVHQEICSPSKVAAQAHCTWLKRQMVLGDHVETTVH
ncbi:uncharacterized protein [Parasteatoda tepidariorum]|uniref:uncharacterized protein n=1 Tax=Parasteatoda tepidariorum TaxID=114398 RepID=UPI00077FCD4F|nr:uncharacterized protein LOC107452665 [Parasteatoda tepidariorum]